MHHRCPSTPLRPLPGGSDRGPRPCSSQRLPLGLTGAVQSLPCFSASPGSWMPPEREKKGDSVCRPSEESFVPWPCWVLSCIPPQPTTGEVQAPKSHRGPLTPFLRIGRLHCHPPGQRAAGLLSAGQALPAMAGSRLRAVGLASVRSAGRRAAEAVFSGGHGGQRWWRPDTVAFWAGPP